MLKDITLGQYLPAIRGAPASTAHEVSHALYIAMIFCVEARYGTCFPYCTSRSRAAGGAFVPAAAQVHSGRCAFC